MEAAPARGTEDDLASNISILLVKKVVEDEANARIGPDPIFRSWRNAIPLNTARYFARPPTTWAAAASTDRDFHPNPCAILAMMPIRVKHLERDFQPRGR